jgi:hypothetical protein
MQASGVSFTNTVGGKKLWCKLIHIPPNPTLSQNLKKILKAKIKAIINNTNQ